MPDYSSILGGQNSLSTGDFAVALGGQNNLCSGTGGVSCGRQARNTHNGTFVFSDDTVQDVDSQEAKQFHIGVQNGLRISHTVEEDGAVIKVAELETTDATTTTLYSETLGDNSCMGITARVVAMEGDGSNRTFWIVQGFVFRDGGGATMQAAAVEQLKVKSAGINWGATIDADTNDVRVRVTGEASTTIRWRATIIKQQVF